MTGAVNGPSGTRTQDRSVMRRLLWPAELTVQSYRCWYESTNRCDLFPSLFPFPSTLYHHLYCLQDSMHVIHDLHTLITCFLCAVRVVSTLPQHYLVECAITPKGSLSSSEVTTFTSSYLLTAFNHTKIALARLTRQVPPALLHLMFTFSIIHGFDLAYVNGETLRS